MTNDLPIAGDSTCGVPVYDCHVLVRGPDAEGLLHGRVANLPGITATARDERHLLQQIVKSFKSELVKFQTSGQAIPWTPGDPRQADERQRWIPVHL